VTALDTLRTELAHTQQRDAIRSARRRLDQLQAEADRLAAMGWARTEQQNRRLGATVTAIAAARQAVADLEAAAESEAAFRFPPILDVTEEVRGRPGTPPTWFIEGPARPAAHQPAARPTPPRARTRRPARRQP
jgi:hypothetical protein